MITDSRYHSKELGKGSLKQKTAWIGLFVHKLHQFEPDTGKNTQVHCVIIDGSIDMVKLKAVSVNFRHSESESGLSFRLTLLLTWVLSTFCPNPQRFLIVFYKMLCKN